jgi:hypothetical protein
MTCVGPQDGATAPHEARHGLCKQCVCSSIHRLQSRHVLAGLVGGPWSLHAPRPHELPLIDYKVPRRVSHTGQGGDRLRDIQHRDSRHRERSGNIRRGVDADMEWEQAISALQEAAAISHRRHLPSASLLSSLGRIGRAGIICRYSSCVRQATDSYRE